jgi:hypothetical protein
VSVDIREYLGSAKRSNTVRSIFSLYPPPYPDQDIEKYSCRYENHVLIRRLLIRERCNIREAPKRRRLGNLN